MKVCWLRSALASLRAIHAYIAAENPKAARLVIAAVRAATEQLATFPDSGHRGTVAGTHEMVVPRLPYLVVYRVREGHFEILRVFHTAQDWPGLM